MEKLKAELAQLAADMQAILDAATDGLLSAEQQSKFDELEKQYDAKRAELKQHEAAEERARKQRERLADIELLNPRLSTPDGVPPKVDVKVLGEGFEKDPKRGFESPREFMLSVMQAERSMRVDDKRLKSLVAPGGVQFLAVGSDEAGTYSDPYGGFLLPSGFSPMLLSVSPESDPTAGRTRRIPMNTQTLEIPARVDKNHTSSVTGGLQVYRRNETDTSSATRIEFEQVKLTATMLFGLSYATEELLQRSPMSFVALLESGFSDEFNAKLLKEKLSGTGAGQYEGVLNAACTVSVAKESGQAAATIVKENIDKMRARCWRYGNAVWLYNHDCLPQLRSLVQTIGTGGSVVPYFSVSSDGTSMLDGRPAFPSEFCETLGTVGDLILGNWGEYLEGTLSGPQQAESIHVRFVNHERTFKFWMENDGRPWWRTALTPNKSSSTLSPFVTLATRA